MKREFGSSVQRDPAPAGAEEAAGTSPALARDPKWRPQRGKVGNPGKGIQRLRALKRQTPFFCQQVCLLFSIQTNRLFYERFDYITIL